MDEGRGQQAVQLSPAQNRVSRDGEMTRAETRHEEESVHGDIHDQQSQRAYGDRGERGGGAAHREKEESGEDVSQLP